ncbi:MAG: twitching motility protein PilT [Verrucomicrobiota bacterium]|nr:twitching motility protein PilT [Verrucomicrobiota bacterium]
MNYTINTIRFCFFLLCIGASFLIGYTITDWDKYRMLALFIGASIGGLVILVDIFLKGFSLRGLSAVTFGMFIGWLNAYFINNSPLFENGDPQILFIVRLAAFVILMYLGAVVALRGKDEFNLVIPYVRFVPHGVDVPLVVVDTSALIDGRILGICASKFMGYALVIPRFVIDELHQIADSSEAQRQARGRKGLEVLNALRKLPHLDIRIHESELDRKHKVEAKLVFLAQSLKAKILTTDYNLAQIAQFHAVEWLNINALSKALHPELMLGDTLELELVKPGKESTQAVGFLNDGSMVVVNDGKRYLGQSVQVEVLSILPSAGGKMVFARMLNDSIIKHSANTMAEGLNKS